MVNMHLCTVKPTSYMYRSKDEYLCFIIYSRKTFSLLPLPFFILIIYYVQYASVYGYTDFLHIQIMERVDIYDKYSFKKQK